MQPVPEQSSAPTDPLWKRLRAAEARVSPQLLLNHFHVVDPPVPVASIATWLDVVVIETASTHREVSFSGSLDVDDDLALITLNGAEAATRRRFTLAHELAHLFLHPGKRHHRDEQLADFDTSEAEANHFAAELLMPEWMLWRALARHRSRRTLAQLFEVSEVALTYRLQALHAESNP